MFYNIVFTHCPFHETKHKHQRNKRNIQSAWEVGEDKIVSSYRKWTSAKLIHQKIIFFLHFYFFLKQNYHQRIITKL
jgi:hypothetical protein